MARPPRRRRSVLEHDGRGRVRACGPGRRERSHCADAARIRHRGRTGRDGGRRRGLCRATVPRERRRRRLRLHDRESSPRPGVRRGTRRRARGGIGRPGGGDGAVGQTGAFRPRCDANRRRDAVHRRVERPRGVVSGRRRVRRGRTPRTRYHGEYGYRVAVAGRRVSDRSGVPSRTPAGWTPCSSRVRTIERFPPSNRSNQTSVCRS